MKLLIWTTLSLTLAAQSAFALTVKGSEVVNKMREISLQEVNVAGSTKIILADAKGISLYTYQDDTDGKSHCSGSCLNVWPALSIDANTPTPAPFGKITGNNGKPQLTLHGLPLYYFIRDKKPGDVFGHYPEWLEVTVEQ